MAQRSAAQDKLANFFQHDGSFFATAAIGGHRGDHFAHKPFRHFTWLSRFKRSKQRADLKFRSGPIGLLG